MRNHCSRRHGSRLISKHRSWSRCPLLGEEADIAEPAERHLLCAPKIPDIAKVIPVRLLKIPDSFPRDLIKKPLWHSAFLPVLSARKDQKSINTLLFSLLAGKSPSETGFARLHPPPPSPCKPHYSETTPNRPFLRGFLPLNSSIFVSARVRPFGWRFLALCLCIQKFRSRRPVLGAKPEPHMRPRFQLLGCCLIRRLRECRSYSGLSPSASNCRLHSAGPRGCLTLGVCCLPPSCR